MKNNFFCKSTAVYLYEKPSHKSKISSQILYGEEFKILLKNKNWLKIKTSFDNYTGYVRKINYVNLGRMKTKIHQVLIFFLLLIKLYLNYQNDEELH